MTKLYEIDLSTANWTVWRGQSKLYAEDLRGLASWIEELENADVKSVSKDGKPYIHGYTINIVS